MATAIRTVGHDERLSVVDHLDELRTRLIVCGVALAVVFGLCLWQNHALLKFINRPLTQQTRHQVEHFEGPLGETWRAQKTTREVAGDSEALARALGDKWAMILENHGALVCGTSLAEAYIYHHFFELACRAQVGALAGGAEVIVPAPEVCEERARKFGRIGQYNHQSRDWVASMALAETLFPGYKE